MSRPRTYILLTCVALGLAACGSDEDSTQEEPASASEQQEDDQAISSPAELPTPSADAVGYIATAAGSEESKSFFAEDGMTYRLHGECTGSFVEYQIYLDDEVHLDGTLACDQVLDVSDVLDGQSGQTDIIVPPVGEDTTALFEIFEE